MIYLRKNILLSPDPEGSLTGGGVATSATPGAQPSTPATTSVSPSQAMSKAAAAKGGGQSKVTPVPESVKNIDFGVSNDLDGLLGTEGLTGEVPISRVAKLNQELNDNDIGDGSPKELSAEEQQQVADASKGKKPDAPKPDSEKEEDKTLTTEDGDKSEEDSGKEKKPVTAKTRSLESFDPEDRPFVKQMSEKASAHFLNKLNKLKGEVGDAKTQLKQIEDGGLPLSYQNHPDAFVLSPEYKQVAINSQNLGKEAAHWRTQLIRVSNNQPWTNIQGFDKSGNIVESEPIAPDAVILEDIRSQYYKADRLRENEVGKLGQLQSKFRADYDVNKKLISDGVSQHLGWLNKPEVQSIKVNVSGIGERTVKELSDGFINDMVPKAYKDHPMTQAAAALFAAYNLAQNLYTTEKGKNSVVDKTNKNIQRAEPVIDGGTGVPPTKKTMNLGSRRNVPDFNFAMDKTMEALGL